VRKIDRLTYAVRSFQDQGSVVLEQYPVVAGYLVGNRYLRAT